MSHDLSQDAMVTNVHYISEYIIVVEKNILFFKIIPYMKTYVMSVLYENTNSTYTLERYLSEFEVEQ